MLKHLDYLMISNGGCDPFHYLKGKGGLGYKPSPPYMHGLGYDYNLIDGMGIKGRGNYKEVIVTDENGDETTELVWEPYDEKQLNKILYGDNGNTEFVKNYWRNEEIGEKDDPEIRDKVDEEQQRILNIIYQNDLIEKTKKQKNLHKNFKEIEEWQNTVNEPHNKYKNVPTVESEESEETKVINLMNKYLMPKTEKDKAIEEYENYINKLKNIEPEKEIIESYDPNKEAIDIKSFEKNTDFENKIAGIKMENVIDNPKLDENGEVQIDSKGNELKHHIQRYDAELVPLDNEENFFIREAVKLVPPLKKEIEKYESTGYKIRVMSYNSNYHVFFEGKPVFAGDSNFKMDTLVDFYFKDPTSLNNRWIPFDNNLLIEEKFYANYQPKQYYTSEAIEYSGTQNVETEKKLFNTERKRVANNLRTLKNNIKTEEDDFDKNKKNLDEEEINIFIEEINKLKNKRIELKKRYESLESSLANINERRPSFIGAPVEVTKFPIPDNFKDYKNKKFQKELKIIRDKAESHTAGYYTMKNGLTSTIKYKDKKTGEEKLYGQNTKIPIYEEKNGKKKEKYIFLPKDNNSKRFADRYVVGAIAGIDGLYMDWIKNNLDLDNLKFGASAYGGKKSNSSVKISYADMTKIFKPSLFERIKAKEKKIKEQEKNIKKNINKFSSLEDVDKAVYLSDKKVKDKLYKLKMSDKLTPEEIDIRINKQNKNIEKYKNFLIDKSK